MKDRYIVEHFNAFAPDGERYHAISYLATDPHPEYRLVYFNEARVDDRHYILQYIWERSLLSLKERLQLLAQEA